MKQFILVAGVDYEFKGVNFRVFCDNRLKRIVAANKAKDELKFQIFDFPKGEILTVEITYPGGKQTKKETKLSPFKSISAANYDSTVSGGETHYRFKDGQRDVMSIVDIYEAVRRIGVSAPNTLAELSIFSHGWMGGPILVNSFDDNTMTINMPMVGTLTFSLPAGMRDPDDKDARIKDFRFPTMDAAELGNFQKAFESNGFVWIWGCAFPRLVHEILHKIEHHPTYKSSGLGDNELFQIKNFNAAQADLLESLIKSDIGGPFPDKKNIVIKFKFLKHFFCKITQASYLHHMAVNSKVKTFGAVMGTYSEYDSGALPLMSVHAGFGKHFTFYKNYLGFDYDPEGRKYGAYKPGFTCPAPPP